MAGLLVALAMALGLRCPQLDRRPMHNDEAVNALKLQTLWERGTYQYDPNEFHGPTLHYLSVGLLKLTGPGEVSSISETRLRMVTVLFGVGLILLLPLVADGLGRRATICAGFLTAISPAMVFYSRYFIHEMLLVFFTFLALAAGWRYTRSRKVGWALLAGAALGLMEATKETFVLNVAAAIGAGLFVWYGNRRACVNDRKTVETVFGTRCLANTPLKQGINEKRDLRACALHLAAALGVWLGTAALFFSSFFSNCGGLLDAVRAYLPWLHRAGGASPHIHPWYFYLERLGYYHVAKGPVWSEGLILCLAIVGMVAAFRKKLPEGAHLGFVRFVAVYTLLLTLVYTALAYKTPWCLVGFWHGMILLAGVGAVVSLQWVSRPQVKVAIAFVLVAGAGRLAAQAWQAGTTFCADPRNPYVYSQTLPDFTNLVAKVESLAEVCPEHKGMLVKVMAPGSDYWPLPWSLRDFTQVGWWTEVPSEPYAPVMIVSSKLHAELDEKKTHVMVGLFQLRANTFLELYVEVGLWRAYLEKTKVEESE